MSSTLRFENFSITRNGREMLRLDDFILNSGEVTGLVGRSGSGKSTTALAAIGLLDDNAITSGKVFIDDKEITAESVKSLRGDEIAILFQDANAVFDPIKTIGKQAIEFITYHTKISNAKANEIFQNSLSEVGLGDAEGILKKYPHQISGGQKQRVQIAFAISLNPKFLLADEITASLDMINAIRILELLDGIRKTKNIGILFISHDLGQVTKLADKIAVLDYGKVIEYNSKDELIRNPQTEIAKSMIAESLPQPIGHTNDAIGDEILSVNGLKKSYSNSRVWALDGVDLSIKRGEICAIIGQSGSGKSTLMKILLGILDFDEGQFKFGQQVFDQKTKPNSLKEYRKNIGIVFQDPNSSFNTNWDVEKIILEPLYARKDLNQTQKAELLNKVTQQVKLDKALLVKKPHQLSGGQKQRVAFARAIINSPELVFLDEAMSALDPVSKAELSDLIDELSAAGTSFFFISHDLRIVENIADNIVVLLGGKIVEQGTPKEIFDNPTNEYTRNLVAATPII